MNRQREWLTFGILTLFSFATQHVHVVVSRADDTCDEVSLHLEPIVAPFRTRQLHIRNNLQVRITHPGRGTNNK